MKRFLLTLAASALCYAASAQVSAEDFAALKSIYETTGGKNWKNNTGWDFQNATPESVQAYNAEQGTGWFGVTEVRKGRVSKLELMANSLSGALPEAAFALTGLRTLNLSGNSLTGSIPRNISEMKLLAVLNLSNNSLSGEIPAAIVQMGSEAKTSAPREEGKGGTEIKVLLNKNALTGEIPAAIGEMALLSKPAKSISLDVSYNSLTGQIPQSMLKLTALTAFKAAGNSLSGTVPAELGTLPALKYLRLEKNAFTGAVPRK